MERLDHVAIEPDTVLVPPGRSIMVNMDMLNQAGLRGEVRVLVRPGEIRILPVGELTAQEMLDALAGCLGGEPVANYDFGLKIGGLYEAR